MCYVCVVVRNVSERSEQEESWAKAGWRPGNEAKKSVLFKGHQSRQLVIDFWDSDDYLEHMLSLLSRCVHVWQKRYLSL